MRNLGLHRDREQRARLAGVVEIIAERIGDRLGHHDRSGEMDDGVYSVAQQETPHEVMISDIALDELRLGRYRPANPVDRLSTTRTSSPASSSSSTIWLPMKPAPPVTSTLIDEPRGTAVAFRRL